MSRRPYLFRDVIEHGKCLHTDGTFFLYCDTHNHYRFGPCESTVLQGCTCKLNPLDPCSHSPIDRANQARHRYEVYNKDGDFFHDHLSGGMVWLKESSRPTEFKGYWIDELVEKIIKLLNQEEHATLLLQARSQPPQPREADGNQERVV